MDRETLEVLRNAGARIVRTDASGATTVQWTAIGRNLTTTACHLPERVGMPREGPIAVIMGHEPENSPPFNWQKPRSIFYNNRNISPTQTGSTAGGYHIGSDRIFFIHLQIVIIPIFTSNCGEAPWVVERRPLGFVKGQWAHNHLNYTD